MNAVQRAENIVLTSKDCLLHLNFLFASKVNGCEFSGDLSSDLVVNVDSKYSQIFTFAISSLIHCCL